MEIVARRKSSTRDIKHEPILQVDEPEGHRKSLWRTWSWTFCLLLGCVCVVTGTLWAQWSSYVAMAKTTATLTLQQLSKLPAIESGERESPIQDPMPSIYVQDVVLFPDDVMLLVRVTKPLNIERGIDSLECQFGGIPYVSVNKTSSPVISIKPRTKHLHVIRCNRPEGKEFSSKYHTNVTLGIRDSEIRVESNAFYHPKDLPNWEFLVYESLIDGDNMVLLVKGLLEKSQKRMDGLKCVFGTNLPNEILYETKVLIAAQEVIRCVKPPDHLDNALRGYRVSILASWLGVLPSVTYYDPDNHPGNFLASFLNRDFSTTAEDPISSLKGNLLSVDDEQIMPTFSETPLIAAIPDEEIRTNNQHKRKLCACIMVWNKAEFIREWVLFHSYMGVEKYFIYDNNSDDNIEEVLSKLSAYNVSRMVWPWMKTHQAVFSHCTILAKDQCEWMLFTDVDEYIYPHGYLKEKNPALPSDAMVLHRLIDSEIGYARKRHKKLGMIEFECHNFGPSGLKNTPKQGVTVGYTCRMKPPLRHKSIVKLDAVDDSLLNVLHHFDLRQGYAYVKLSRRVAVCNHYKFQAWDAFKMKFVRRAGTYTTDWKKTENLHSQDRTPGLGVKAVKPADWEHRFCQVRDTGLRDFVLKTFAVPGEHDKMLWQLK